MMRSWPPGGATLICGAPLTNPPPLLVSPPTYSRRPYRSHTWTCLRATYLVRQRSKADGRSVSLRLTSKGKKALLRDPFEVLVRAVDLLDAKERTVMHHAL